LAIDTSNEVSPRRSAGTGSRIAGLPAPLFLLLVGVFAFAILHPLDATVNGWLQDLRPHGDLKREWEALQQFGQGVSIVIISLTLFLLDPPRRARLLDLALALALVGMSVTAMKWLIGRPRPTFDDARTFLFPWGTYPVKLDDGSTVNAHAWDWSVPTHAQLWSMPSSHTAFAVTTALFLAILYPRIRWLVAFLALTVAAGRLVFDAHWLSDVVTGATVAAAIAWPVIAGGWGMRLAQRLRGA
jgi:membrane-associated phospholipid phosphatase